MEFLSSFLSLWAWCAIGVITLFWSSLIALVFLIHPLIDPKREILHSMAGMWGRSLIRLAPGCRVQIVGRENLPTKGPVIYMANHQSYVDVPLLFFVHRPFKWMADVYLFSIPFFGWAMKMAGYIPVRRGDPRAAVRSMEEGTAWLRKGISVFLFPEGTRSRTGVFGRFHVGGFRLAARTGTSVVPVVVEGTRQLLPRGRWSFRIGVTLVIHILPAQTIPNAQSKGLHIMARRLRREMMIVFRHHLEQRNRSLKEVVLG